MKFKSLHLHYRLFFGLCFLLGVKNFGLCQTSTTRLIIVNAKTNMGVEDVQVLSEKNSYTSDAFGRVEIVFYDTVSRFFEINHIQFNRVILKIDPSNPISDSIFLMERNYSLKEYVINRPQLIQGGHGVIRFGQDYLNNSPMIFSIRDPIKLVQLTPGVSPGEEANTDLHVRGGNHDQTKIIVDDIVVKSGSHLLGLFSSVNGDILNDIVFYKSSVPLEVNSGSSGVVLMTTKTNMDSLVVKLGASIISANGEISIPIIKNKWGLMIAGRTSYIDKFTDLGGLVTKFNDVNITTFGKVKNNQFKISFITLQDQYNFNESQVYFGKFGNIKSDLSGVSLRWDKTPSKSFKISSVFSMTSSNRVHSIPEEDYRSSSNLDEYNLTINMKKKTKNGSLSFGYLGNLFSVVNTHMRIDSDTLEQTSNKSQVYLENVVRFERRLKLTYGVSVGHTQVKNIYLEPRLEFYFPTTRLSLSFDRRFQFFQSLSNTVISLPFDQWVLSNDQFAYIEANQINLGYSHYLRNLLGKIHIETYVKKISGSLDFKDGANYLESKIDASTYATSTDGLSSGFEVFYQKMKGKNKGIISYTFSKSIRMSQYINNGNWYNAHFDRPHNLNISFRKVSGNEKWSFNGLFVLQSGRPMTLPIIIKPLIYSERNQIRGTMYHRLDLSMNYSSYFKAKKIITNWSLNIYNVYNAANAYHIYYDLREGKVQKKTIFPILPTAGFSLNFM